MKLKSDFATVATVQARLMVRLVQTFTDAGGDPDSIISKMLEDETFMRTVGSIATDNLMSAEPQTIRATPDLASSLYSSLAGSVCDQREIKCLPGGEGFDDEVNNGMDFYHAHWRLNNICRQEPPSDNLSLPAEYRFWHPVGKLMTVSQVGCYLRWRKLQPASFREILAVRKAGHWIPVNMVWIHPEPGPNDAAALSLVQVRKGGQAKMFYMRDCDGDQLNKHDWVVVRESQPA